LGHHRHRHALAVPWAGRDAAGVAATTWPTLTRTNYNTWSLLMKVILQAWHLWDVIKTREGKYKDDRAALEGLLRSVPVEMIPVLAVKSMAKEAWDMIKTICVGAERVCESKAQILHGQYEEIRFKAGESVDDFGLRQ
jgi:hypothetical protein